MAVPPSSSPTKLSDVKTEFGPSNPTTANNLRAYLKYPGGTYVGNTPNTSQVPTGTAPDSTSLPLRSFAGESRGGVSITHTYSAGSLGPGTETIPSGATTMIVELWGGGGGGGSGLNASLPARVGGGGGGSGGYVRVQYPIVGTNWGQTIPYTVGSGNSGGSNPTGISPSPGNDGFDSTLNPGGTFPLSLTGAVTAGGGKKGSGTATQGAGGTNTIPTPGPAVLANTPGNQGNAGSPASGGPGGPAVSGAPYNPSSAGAGGAGGFATAPAPGNSGPGTGGSYGQIIFHYT